MTAMRHTTISTICVLLLIVSATGAAAVPGDENWSSGFGLPGVAGYVAATTTLGTDLVIGGAFTGVGDVAATNVARWNGAQWSPLGAGLSDDVTSLIVWNSVLYAGGGFTGGLARWDGAAWVVVDSGVDGYVHTLAVWNGNLVVAGNFSSVGSANLAAANIAIYNGATWSALGSGTNGYINDVEVFGTSLYVCGAFDFAGSAYAPNLARWSGSAWFAVGGGLLDIDGEPYGASGETLAVHGSRLVVGGYFVQAGSLAANGLVGWSGSAFSAVGTPPFTGEALALGRWGADLVAADVNGAVGRWNGTFWTYLGGALGAVYTLDQHLGNVIAGGAFSQVGSLKAASLASYNGAWTTLAQGQGANGTVECVGAWNGLTIVGGRFGQIGAVSGSIAAWNGTAFQALGAGIPLGPGTTVEAVTTFEGDLVVGGAFTTAGGVAANKIARWDGAQWSAMGAGSLATVSGLIVLDGVLYANGYWGTRQTLGRWNGTDFDPLGNGINGGVQILYGLGSYQGDPVMAGSFNTVDGVAAANIARWDGAAWQPLGAGTNGAVFAVAERNGVLYAAGIFSQAGGAPASNIAAWNGSTWSPLGSGVSNRVFDLAVIGNDLYATGEFTTAGGQAAAHVARWDGSAWHALGSGLGAEGHALAAPGDGRLWVGGEFEVAGDRLSSHIARWQAAASAVEADPRAVRIALKPAWPNPFTARTAFAFDLPTPGDVVVDVFDVRGARVRTIGEPGLPAGSHRIAWDGRDEAGRPVPAGVYFAAVRGVGAASRQRVVLVR